MKIEHMIASLLVLLYMASECRGISCYKTGYGYYGIETRKASCRDYDQNACYHIQSSKFIKSFFVIM